MYREGRASPAVKRKVEAAALLAHRNEQLRPRLLAVIEAGTSLEELSATHQLSIGKLKVFREGSWLAAETLDEIEAKIG